MLMPHESVMTAKETNDFLPTLKAIRKGNVDAELLNSVSQGQEPVIVDSSKIIEVPRDSITIDENGLSIHQFRKNMSLIKKQNRYRTNVI